MCISSRELYGLLHDDPTHYCRWVKKFISENKLAINNLDYFKADKDEQGIRVSKNNYYLTLDFCKEILQAYRTMTSVHIKEVILNMQGYDLKKLGFVN